MTTYIKNSKQLRKILTNAQKRAKHSTAIIIRSELERKISELFYENYTPIKYERTYRLLTEAPKIETLNQFETIVGIYSDGIFYDHDDTEAIYNLAMQGYHGTTEITGNKYYHVWNEFKLWCDENVMRIYKEELEKELQGLQF